MSVVSLLPQSGLISRVGPFLQGQDGGNLSSTTGVGSPANYVKSGITAPDDTTYWSNTATAGPKTSSFYVGVDKLTLSPSGLTFKFRGSIVAGASLSLRDFEVWLRKEHNPSLVSDIQVASGLSTISVTGLGNSNYSSTLQIIEANRTAFESGIPDLWMCVSGIISLIGISSGLMTFNEMEVELSGTLPTPWNSADLFIQGSSQSSGNADLFTFNSETSSGNADLYIGGYSTGSGSFDLYTLSIGTESGNFDLYTQGHLSSSGNFDLYMYGIGSGLGSMNLFTSGPIGVPYSGAYVPLSIWSETNSGVFGQVSLTVYNESTFSPLNAMNLVLTGPSYQTQTGSMNLILSSDPSVTNQFNLYLCNDYTLSSGWTPLYITTPSGTEGSVPLSGIMNLVIWKDADSIAEWVPLVLSNGGSGNNNVNLYIYGNTVAESSTPLYMHGIVQSTNNFNLYTHGF